MSLRQKLLIPQLLITAAIAAYIFGIWMPQTLDEAQKGRLQLIERHLDTVESGLVPLLLGNQLDIIRENLTDIANKNADWVAVRLFDVQGRQLYPPAVGTRPQPSALHRRSVERSITYLATPLGKLVIDLDMEPSLTHDRQEYVHLAWRVLGLLGLMLVVTMATLELAVRYPLGLLACASTALARREFAAPLPHAGADEVGVLVNSFAVMRDNLNDFQARILQEVAERRQAEATLRERETMYRSLVAAMAEGVVFCDASGAVTTINPAAEKILAFAKERSAQSEWFSLPFIHTDGSPFLNREHPSAATLHTGQPQNDIVMGVKNRDQNVTWISVNSQPLTEDGETKPYAVVSTFRDITARKKAEEKVEYLAHHDLLTGLPNKRLGEDRFEMAMRLAETQSCKAALMFLDLDGFKYINDSLGHATGDTLLCAVSERLKTCLRPTDTIARQGGDEFLLILAEIANPKAITTLALRVLEELSKPFTIDDHQLSITTSLGIAVYPDDGGDWNTLHKKADMAMYSAKEAGRNTYRFFTDQMNANADEYLRLHNKLQYALERQEFVLHYQPQVDLKTGLVTGVEALIRWHNADLGLVPPGRFISLAEDSGLIVPIGGWALKEACRQAVEWRNAGLPAMLMAVNLSAVQFRSGNVLSSVKQALEETGLDPNSLELEMTESILIKDTEHVLTTVQQLKAMGVKLSIDDFGTGYSSLSYLKRFDVDKVKIDQSFIRDIVTDANSKIIVSTIVRMAQGLGLTTIAEGVENKQVLETLRQYQCDEAQGYYYAKPMPAKRAEVFLKTRQ
jgi:diguanylate cyclase (GGDEF)-like protein/PAS domain S-box-containing protein